MTFKNGRVFVLVAVVLLVAVVAVYVYGVLGPTTKTLLAVDILVLLLAAVAMRARRMRSRRAIAVMLSFLLLGWPVAVGTVIRDSFSFKRRSDDSMQFWYRVDRFTDRTARLYHSFYFFLPDSFYGAMKHRLGLPYFPKLRDRSHLYDRITAVLYHIGHTGVVEYTSSGQCLGNDPDSVWFAFQGEAAAKDPYKQIRTMSCAGDTLDGHLCPVAVLGDYYACVGHVGVESHFCFTRTFCAIGAQGDSREGFMLNFDSIEHPPREIEVTFVTDQSVDSLAIYRLRRHWTLGRWLTAQPLYRRSYLGRLKRVPNEVNGEIMKGLLDGSHGPVDPSRVRMWSATVPCEKRGNIDLIRYRVDLWPEARLGSRINAPPVGR